jgi:hypothetical protein
MRLGIFKSFVPPMFGITMLGNSDGFDKDGTTTGFVVRVASADTNPVCL